MNHSSTKIENPKPITIVHARTAPRQNGTSKEVTLELVKPSKKVGRNDPCPCGSGLKSKRCHNGILIPKPPIDGEYAKR